MSQVSRSTVKAPQIQTSVHQESFSCAHPNMEFPGETVLKSAVSLTGMLQYELFEIGRCCAFHASIGKGHNLMIDALRHREPVELFKNWGDIVMLLYPCHNACCS